MVDRAQYDSVIAQKFRKTELKRSTSGVIWKDHANRIISHLKDPTHDKDKIFRYYVKKNRFELVAIASIDIRDVLAVKVLKKEEERRVKEEEEVLRKLFN